MTVPTEAEIEAALIAAEKLDWRTLRSTIKAALEAAAIAREGAKPPAAAATVREGKKRGTRQWPTPESFA